MRLLTVPEAEALMRAAWNGCFDYHENQGKNDVRYPDLDELVERFKKGAMKYQFRKIKRIGAMEQVSYPMDRDVKFDTIGLYRNNPDGTQTFLDEMTEDEMKDFREQKDFLEVLTKLK